MFNEWWICLHIALWFYGIMPMINARLVRRGASTIHHKYNNHEYHV